MPRRLVGTALLLLAVTLGACRRKQVPVAEVPTAPSTAGATEPIPARASAGTPASADSIANAAAMAVARLRDALTAVVYFEYDAADITNDGRVVLDLKLSILRVNPPVRLRISGHTDERGSDEYNMALGLRRAAAARKYLVDRGIAASRIDIVSFGEENPAASGADEQAFSQNRRATFEIVAGEGQLTVTPR